MNSKLVATALLGVGLLPVSTPMPGEPTPPTTGIFTNMDNSAVTVAGHASQSQGGEGANASAVSADEKPVVKVVHEYRLSLACGSTASPSNANDVTACTAAMTACAYMDPPSPLPQMYLWRRVAGSMGAWEYLGTTCVPRPDLPGAAQPPPVPTFGQIQEAFRRLPFGRPVVHVQPEGGVTLVNLPTFYQVRWPQAGLAPGEVSEPVSLLSWRVEFEVGLGGYDFDFGDGSRSGPTRDAGGPYPSGGVRHVYGSASEGAPVRVDARLTGRFRVNGGGWEDIDTVADLQDEPVTVVRVREARARLYTS